MGFFFFNPDLDEMPELQRQDFDHLEKPDVALRYFSTIFSVAASLHSALLSEVRFWLTLMTTAFGLVSAELLRQFVSFVDKDIPLPLKVVGLILIGSGVLCVLAIIRIVEFMSHSPTVADISFQPLLDMQGSIDKEKDQVCEQLRYFANTYRALHSIIVNRESMLVTIRLISTVSVVLALVSWLLSRSLI